MNYFLDVNLLMDESRIIFIYIFFLGNFVEPFSMSTVIASSNIKPLHVLWSVGVEEQFYLFWPFLFRATKKLVVVLALIIVFYQLSKLTLRLVNIDNLIVFLQLTRIDCMAIGGLGAYVLKNKDSKTIQGLYKLITSPYAQFFAFCFL